MRTQAFWQSVLSGLSPAIILEICGRSGAPQCILPVPDISVEQCLSGSTKATRSCTNPLNSYVIPHTTAFRAFQQAVLKSVNDRAAQLQKHVENVVREGILIIIYHRLDTEQIIANSELSLLQSKVAGALNTLSWYAYSVGRHGARPRTREKKEQGHARPTT